MEFQGKKVLVVGMAKSGISAAHLLLKLGAEVLLYDRKTAEHFQLDSLFDKGARDFLGKDPMEAVKEAEILIMSPGVPRRKRRESRFSRKSSWDI